MFSVVTVVCMCVQSIYACVCIPISQAHVLIKGTVTRMRMTVCISAYACDNLQIKWSLMRSSFTASFNSSCRNTSRLIVSFLASATYASFLPENQTQHNQCEYPPSIHMHALWPIQTSGDHCAAYPQRDQTSDHRTRLNKNLSDGCYKNLWHILRCCWLAVAVICKNCKSMWKF